jgi:hypothetical protein
MKWSHAAAAKGRRQSGEGCQQHRHSHRSPRDHSRREGLMKWTVSIAAIVVVALLVRALLLWLADFGSNSLRSQYQAEVRRQKERLEQANAAPTSVVTEAELATLPPAIATFLRRAGVVGKPRPRSVHAVFRARMRNGPADGWMEATAEQHNFYGPSGPARLFLMQASRLGLPFVAYHRYVGEAATFQVRAAGLVTVVDARGPEMNQSETVTMLNDMFFLAPGALLGADIGWEPLPEGRVKATFSNAGQTVSALVSFDANGDLRDFVSTDRYQSDGKVYKLLPWFTPVEDFRDFGGIRLARKGEARWRDPVAGEWAYAQFLIERITYE